MKVAVWLSPDDTLAAPLPWGKHAVPGAARHLLSRKPFQAKWTAVTDISFASFFLPGSAGGLMTGMLVCRQR
jgi:hypothetical protein